MSTQALHWGARHVPHTQIKDSPTPAGSTTYSPVARWRLLKRVESTFTSSGRAIVTRPTLWQRDGRYFALWEAKPVPA